MKYGHVKFHERWPLLTIHSSVWHNKWIKKNKVDASDLCKINLQKTNFPLSSNLSSNSWQGYDGFKMHHIKKTYECVLEQEKTFVWHTKMKYFIHTCGCKKWQMSHIKWYLYPGILKKISEIHVLYNKSGFVSLTNKTVLLFIDI